MKQATLILIALLIAVLNLNAQPVPYGLIKDRFTKKGGMTKTEEEHFKDYKGKFEKMEKKYMNYKRDDDDDISDYETAAYNYYTGINLDAFDEFKKLNIHLDSLWFIRSNDRFYRIPVGEKFITSPVIIKGTIMKRKFPHPMYGDTRLTVKVDEVVKGKYYYQVAPDTIVVIASPSTVSVEMKGNERIQSDNETPQVGTSMLLMLRDFHLFDDGKISQRLKEARDYENNQNVYLNFIKEYANDENLRLIKKIEELNASELNHSARKK